MTSHLIICDAFTIDCEYTVQSWAYVDSAYTCMGTIRLEDGSNSTLTAINGNHIPGITNANVEALSIYEQNLTQFPMNVERFFPNLKVIHLSDNLINSVSNEFLRPHKYLVWLGLPGNKITKLESNIFDGLPHLRIIDFYGNKIKDVGQDIKLPKTGNINFYSNLCIDMGAATDDKIAELEYNLVHKCSYSLRLSRIEEILMNIMNGIEELKGNPNKISHTSSY